MITTIVELLGVQGHRKSVVSKIIDQGINTVLEKIVEWGEQPDVVFQVFQNSFYIEEPGKEPITITFTLKN
jgi:hypothetical protein